MRQLSRKQKPYSISFTQGILCILTELYVMSHTMNYLRTLM